MQEFGTFAKYHNVQDAEPLLELFRNNNILFNIYQERNQLDPVFIGDAMDPMIIVSIPTDQFTKANQLTAQELTAGDIPFDDMDPVPSAQQIVPEKLSTQWIVFGYVLSIFMLAGIFCGLVLIHSTRRLSDGSKTKMYDQQTITHGRIIVCIGILSTIFWLTRKTQLWLLF